MLNPKVEDEEDEEEEESEEGKWLVQDSVDKLHM